MLREFHFPRIRVPLTAQKVNPTVPFAVHATLDLSELCGSTCGLGTLRVEPQRVRGCVSRACGVVVGPPGEKECKVRSEN
ncbi:hypothetical protein NQZ68_032851 [Dissostichus eleginoides]|nr:hypothetical protein NQZ68_032851 [Dissostichus eleginoides]